MNYYGSLVENSGSGSGGSSSVDVPIKTIKVNGTAQVPVNKAVDITVPTKTSDLTDDTHVEITKANYEALSDDEKANGTLYFCTDTGELFKNGTPYGGSSSSSDVEVPIESIKVNGTALVPDANKTVDITVPVQETVTQAEYDALVDADTIKAGVEYFCSDTGIVYKDGVKYGASDSSETASQYFGEFLTLSEFLALPDVPIDSCGSVYTLATLFDTDYFATPYDKAIRLYVTRDNFSDEDALPARYGFLTIEPYHYETDGDVYNKLRVTLVCDTTVYDGYVDSDAEIITWKSSAITLNVATTFKEAKIATTDEEDDGADLAVIPTSSLANVAKVAFLNFGGSNPTFASKPDGASDIGSLTVIPHFNKDGSVDTSVPFTLVWIDAETQDGIFGTYGVDTDTVTWVSNALDISDVVDTEITDASDDTKIPTSKAVREFVEANAGGSSNTVVVTQQEYDDMVDVDECLPDTAYFCSDTGRIYMNDYCCTVPRFIPQTQAEYEDILEENGGIGYAEGIVYYCSDTQRIYLNGVAYGSSDISSIIEAEITEASDDTKVPSSKAVKTYVDNQTVTVDEVLSATSENAVQNKVVKTYLDELGYLYSPSGFKFKIQVADDGTLSAASVSQANLFTFDTTKVDGSTTVTLQEYTGGVDNYDGTTNWGDGTVDNSLSHTYASDGTYTVETKYLINNRTTGDANTRKMLVDCNAINSDITDFSYLFYNCSNLVSLDASSWDITKATDITCLFSGCSSLSTLKVAKWNTSNIIKMSSVFNNCSSLRTLDINDWDVSNVNTMVSMFTGSALTELDLSNWNTKNVTSMNGTFRNCKSLTKLTQNFDMSKVTNIGYMFNSCNALVDLDVSNWNTSNITTMGNTFSGCSVLTELDVSAWDVSNVTDMYAMFQQAGITNLDLSAWDVSKVKDMSNMFTYGAIETVNISNWNAEVCNNIMYLFGACQKLHTLQADNVNFPNAKNMMSMFYGDVLLTSIDMSTWNMPSLGGMPSTFMQCSGLTSIKLSGLDTSNITTLANTFAQCTALTDLDISGCDFSKVTNISGTFNKTTALTLDDINMTDCNEETVIKITDAFNARTV